jgi:hypothetical protein
MKMTAARNVVGVVNFTTWMPSAVFVVSTGVMLSGMGRSNGTLRSTFVNAAEDGDGVAETLGQVGVGTGFGVGRALGVLLLPQPAAADVTATATTPESASLTTFTPSRYSTGNDTICW